MNLHEPATFATDLVLAALGFWFAFRLRREERESSVGQWWIRSMLLMAISALVGGFYHGFAPELPPAIGEMWWCIVLWIICGLGFAMGMSLLCELVTAERRRGWIVLLVAKLAASSVLVFVKPEFVIAIIDYGSAMFAWLAAALILRRPWSPAMATGVLLSFLAGAVQQLQWGLSTSFNHNDVFHVIQALALGCFYRAGTKLGEDCSMKAASSGSRETETAKEG